MSGVLVVVEHRKGALPREGLAKRRRVGPKMEPACCRGKAPKRTGINVSGSSIKV